jgi:hypothetical protein
MQTTLDGSEYVERNRLGQPVERVKKQQPGDYVLGVFGSQRLNATDWVVERLDAFVQRNRERAPLQVVVGTGKGVPASAVVWARKRNIPVRILDASPDYLEKWPRKQFDRLALARRDEDLLDLADVVVTFWEHQQKTTPAIITRADHFGKLTRNFYLKEFSE